MLYEEKKFGQIDLFFQSVARSILKLISLQIEKISQFGQIVCVVQDRLHKDVNLFCYIKCFTIQHTFSVFHLLALARAKDLYFERQQIDPKNSFIIDLEFKLLYHL